MAPPNPLEPLLDRLRDLLGEPGLAQLLPDIDRLLAQFELVPRATFDNHLRTLEELQARVAELETQLVRLETGND